jgi:hypothetical protein
MQEGANHSCLKWKLSNYTDVSDQMEHHEQTQHKITGSQHNRTSSEAPNTHKEAEQLAHCLYNATTAQGTQSVAMTSSTTTTGQAIALSSRPLSPS